MKKTLLFLTLLIFPISLKASNVAIYSTTTFRVSDYLKSVDTNQYINRVDVLINPSTAAVSGVDIIYWKVVVDQIEEMTQPEKDQVDLDILLARIFSVHEGGKESLDEFNFIPILLRALADITKDEVNVLRQWDMSLKAAVAASSNLSQLKTNIAALDDLPDRTLVQLRNAIKNRIDSGDVDN